MRPSINYQGAHATQRIVILRGATSCADSGARIVGVARPRGARHVAPNPRRVSSKAIVLPIAVTGIGGTLLASISAVAHKHDRKPFHLLVAACALSATGSPSMVAMAPGAIGRHVQRHVSGVCDDAGPQIGYSPVANSRSRQQHQLRRDTNYSASLAWLDKRRIRRGAWRMQASSSLAIENPHLVFVVARAGHCRCRHGFLETRHVRG